jgi:hypothetical protein
MSIYVLTCEDKKYYIGKTTNLGNRIKEHFDGKGSVWTMKYKPIGVVEISKEGNKYDEDRFVLSYMEKYGIDNVRGGSYSQIELSYKQKKYLERQIATANNLCFRCGRKGHFANKCYAKTHINGTKLETRICMRCLRIGHSIDQCYAKTKSNGKKIN